MVFEIPIPQQGFGVRVARRFVHALDRADFDNAPQVHDRNAVWQVTHDGQIVRDEQARDVEGRLNFLQQVDDLSLHGHIERRHRLVAHQHLTRNLGMGQANVEELERGLPFIKTLLRGEPASLDDGHTAHIPWVRGAPKVFLAGSGPKTLKLAGRVADGAFVNFGIAAVNIRQSEAAVAAGAAEAGRDPRSVEQWQIASLDCNEDGAAARDAGLERVMFTVSLASDPARTVELFGERVLPLVKQTQTH